MNMVPDDIKVSPIFLAIQNIWSHKFMTEIICGGQNNLWQLKKTKAKLHKEEFYTDFNNYIS